MYIFYKAFIELKMHTHIHTKESRVQRKIASFRPDFGNTRKYNNFCRELANMRLTKELKAFLEFTKSLQTSATLARDNNYQNPTNAWPYH